MTDDLLERMRAANPVAEQRPAPPLRDILARAGDQHSPGATARVGRRSLAVPVAGVLVALAVGVIAIVALGAGRDSTRTPERQPSFALSPIRSGSTMPGVVFAGAVAFPSASRTVLSVSQCEPCDAPHAQVFHGWLVSSDDHGRSWQAAHAPWLTTIEFADPSDVWALASRSGSPGGADVSHDGGATWRPVPAGRGWEISGVSVAGGAVWAVAQPTHKRTCTVAGFCPERIYTGDASGSTLHLVASQPLRSGPTSATITAAGAQTAYIDTVGDGPSHLVTSDGGRSWSALPDYCRLAGPDRTLSVAGPRTLWRFCALRNMTEVVGRSTDGGRHWRTVHSGLPVARWFQAVSASVAWELARGQVIRLTDGGAQARPVLTLPNGPQLPNYGQVAGLTATDAETAYLTLLVRRVRHGHLGGTSAEIYTTHNAGRTWHLIRVPLPDGS